MRTTLKIAEVAPMPSASVSKAAAVKPGARAAAREGVAEVTHRVFEQREPDLVARALGGAGDAPEPEQRLAPGLLRAHAGAPVLLGLLIDVKANLFVETASRARGVPRGHRGGASSPMSHCMMGLSSSS